MNAPLCQTHYIQVYDLEGTAILGLSRKDISMETSSIIGGQHEQPGFCSSSFQLEHFISSVFARPSPYMADRRATARTTETFSHAASSQKQKNCSCAGLAGTYRKVFHHVLPVRYTVPLLLSCRWVCEGKEKASPVCWPLRLLKQKLGSCASSSARVSQVTYQTVVGV